MVLPDRKGFPPFFWSVLPSGILPPSGNHPWLCWKTAELATAPQDRSSIPEIVRSNELCPYQLKAKIRYCIGKRYFGDSRSQNLPSPSAGIVSKIPMNFNISLCKNLRSHSSFCRFSGVSFFWRACQYFRHFGTARSSCSLRPCKKLIVFNSHRATNLSKKIVIVGTTAR